MNTIAEDVRERIANGDSKGAISRLHIYIKEFNNEFLNESTILSGRISELHQKKRIGLISNAEYNLESVKLSYDILSLLDELDNTSINEIEINQDDTKKAYEKFKTLIKGYNSSESFENTKSEIDQIVEIPDYTGLENAINYHKKTIEVWAKTFSFKDLQGSKDTAKVYIDLDFYVTPRKFLMGDGFEEKTINIKDVFMSSNQNIVILGQPGAGKTTTMRMIVNWVLKQDKPQLLDFRFPILIRLRDLNEGGSKNNLFEKLFDILGMSILIRVVLIRESTS